jgi:hypothetical protein
MLHQTLRLALLPCFGKAGGEMAVCEDGTTLACLPIRTDNGLSAHDRQAAKIRRSAFFIRLACPMTAMDERRTVN